MIATKLAGVLSVRLGQPSVLGKLIIGVIIGPAVLDWVQNTEVIEALSHIGVLLLMFIAGLETDLKELNREQKFILSCSGWRCYFTANWWISCQGLRLGWIKVMRFSLDYCFVRLQ